MLPYVVPKPLRTDMKLDKFLGEVIYKILIYMAE